MTQMPRDGLHSFLAGSERQERKVPPETQWATITTIPPD